MYGGMPFFGGFQGDDDHDDHHHHDDDDEHDHHGHSHAHGGHGHSHGGGSSTDTNKLYQLLGVEKNATPDEIRKAYKKLAIQLHPDKGGDEAKFKEVTEAANILLDEKKREIYDKYGMKGIDAGLDKQGDESDLLSMFFGGGGSKQQEQRIAPIKIKFPVSLESLYLGKKIQLEIDRKRICTDCKGSGSTNPNAQTTCDECHGQGIKVSIQRIGPGFAQQVRSHCPKCAGTGEYIPENEKCQKCQGKTIVAEKHDLNIVIEKGMRDGEQIVFEGEGHQIPKMRPGDVVLFLSCVDHKTFTRKGNDLKTELKISLVEAISSQKIYLSHLDGHVLSIERPANFIISPGETMLVSGEGMPKRENPFFKGDLFITFSVEFPKTLSPTVQTNLIELLTPSCECFATDIEKVKAASKKVKTEKKTQAESDEEDMAEEKKEEEKKKEEETEKKEEDHEDEIVECTMEQANMNQFGKKPTSHNEAYHEDDGEGEGDEGGAPRVGCQQM